MKLASPAVSGLATESLAVPSQLPGPLPESEAAWGCPAGVASGLLVSANIPLPPHSGPFSSFSGMPCLPPSLSLSGLGGNVQSKSSLSLSLQPLAMWRTAGWDLSFALLPEEMGISKPGAMFSASK